MDRFIHIISACSAWAVPVLISLILIDGFLHKVDIYDAFIEGSTEGIQLVFHILPYLLAIYAAIRLFKDSGALTFLVNSLRPVLTACHIPGEIIPILITRPISGPASIGILTELFDSYGPDSLIGRMASTAMGSTDTTLYIIAIYFASVHIKNSRYAIPVGLLADLAGFLSAVLVCNYYFR